jgi:hypothetical protein
VLTVNEETTDLSFLLSAPALLAALAAFYIGRSLWIARREWPHCGTDTKVLYLMVAPLLTLAVDLLEATDRLFWSRREEKKEAKFARVQRPRSAPAARPLSVSQLRAKPAMRSNG